MPQETTGSVIRMTTVEVIIHIHNRDPIDRVIGPNGQEWRDHMYDFTTEDEVLDHWAHNAVAHGVVDVCQIDGWADVPAETVTFEVRRP